MSRFHENTEKLAQGIAHTESEGERIAKLKTSLRHVEQRLQSCLMPVGIALTKLEDVLGETPVSSTLKYVNRELRLTRRLLAEAIKEG